MDRRAMLTATLRDLALRRQAMQRHERRAQARSLMIVNTMRQALGADPVTLDGAQQAMKRTDKDAFHALVGRHLDWVQSLSENDEEGSHSQ